MMCIADAILTKSRIVNGNLNHSGNWYYIEFFLANNALNVSTSLESFYFTYYILYIIYYHSILLNCPAYYYYYLY